MSNLCLLCMTNTVNYKTPCHHMISCQDCWNKYEEICIRNHTIPKCMICRHQSFLNLSWKGWIYFTKSLWDHFNEIMIDYNSTIYGQEF